VDTVLIIPIHQEKKKKVRMPKTCYEEEENEAGKCGLKKWGKEKTMTSRQDLSRQRRPHGLKGVEKRAKALGVSTESSSEKSRSWTAFK